ncbi:MAG: DNA polymerase III subunit epsilon [Zetaproteobacteria bacterium CG06_land_8_20_14_3_00_59_53]|nr:MAG: DNA polymerase III subunit epsilon [Zetaproteobacteria bacterium CG23_combo_of_CG06-09_8_20_14_all_59_86]PIQ65784.1 MAG: DNA polymerase III subunit epsilon [Zetaproteobacteria bacterium CG11_big_fil_rev_8_21_14_0_20_59_439]PIU70935.1 MAG: DNA polymerase III subunit epsilon [Zetaproteobacteria bacterium CG06_land_8_20_14_3_00_59_53]PIU97088.1 MAG: DNA polymerase III subunit epsilon [Zetaproteobacteria bacterium CG03_land_8_20_14_0_80_59_51]PIY46498.1 MAG: DNA polymerase III subunit epsil
MQLIMLDTETTGLSPLSGDRIVEIGAVRVSQRRIDRKQVFHHYLNPDRHIPEEVVRIHGISDKDVRDKPRFADIGGEFLDFIKDATLVIHNAAFDLGFLMHELRLAGLPDISDIPVIDSLQVARKRHPQQRNNLDALCDRYNVERGHRTLHGALLDAELLAEMYLAMTGGNQFSLDVETTVFPASNFVQLPETSSGRAEKAETAALTRRPALPVAEDDMQAHRLMLERIHRESGQAIWLLPVEAPQN